MENSRNKQLINIYSLATLSNVMTFCTAWVVLFMLYILPAHYSPSSHLSYLMDCRGISIHAQVTFILLCNGPKMQQ
jgi:hypothetical protein